MSLNTLLSFKINLCAFFQHDYYLTKEPKCSKQRFCGQFGVIVAENIEERVVYNKKKFFLKLDSNPCLAL